MGIILLVGRENGSRAVRVCGGLEAARAIIVEHAAVGYRAHHRRAITLGKLLRDSFGAHLLDSHSRCLGLRHKGLRLGVHLFLLCHLRRGPRRQSFGLMHLLEELN